MKAAGIILGTVAVAAAAFAVIRYPSTFVIGNISTSTAGTPSGTGPHAPAYVVTTVDTSTYNAKLLAIANLPPPKVVTVIVGTSTTSTVTKVIQASSSWPVKAAYPNAGALLPYNRIVAYYGNFYSKQMGVLGEYPEDQVLGMLASTTAMWAAADPTTPVIPAIDYIAVAAQAGAGRDGMYRLRMPDDQIEKAITMADKLNGVVFLDVQIGLSTVEKEVPLLADFLKLPNVHLSIDPEFAMHNGARPGTVIGTLDAADINFAAQFLANIVKENNLPPKILVVHRFTEHMVTNYKNIQPLPEVQIVMDMDGFGPPSQKLTTYRDFIWSEPVQFTGFKLFYKNDVTIGGHLMAPSEVLKLSPQPSYIQYQ